MTDSVLRRPVFEEIKDLRVREGLQWMYEYLLAQSLLQGVFEHFELSFSNTGSITHIIPHRLGFVPSDIIPTSSIGVGTAVYNYASFTDENISITTSGGAVTIRFFGGKYEPNNIF